MPDNQDPKDKEEKKPDPVMDVLNDLREKVENLKPEPEESKQVPPADTWKEQREADRKALGFTEEQMQAHERSQMRINAPVVEQTAWSVIDKRTDIDTYRDEIKKELAIYPPERRTADILEKIYYMVRGKHADSKPIIPEKKSLGVDRTRITGGPGYTGNEPGLSGGKEDKKDEGVELDEREKFVADKLGVTSEDYQKSKKVGKEIRELRLPDTRPVNSLADVELRRLTGRR